MRLERLLASRGAGSRRDCGGLIRAGRVMVNGEVVRAPSKQVSPRDAVCVDGEVVSEVPLLVGYYKPLGVLSTYGDPMGRESLEDTTPKEWRRMGLHPVGRLDADTTGLLLFSSDGKLTQRLLHPRSCIEREYVAQVEGDASVPNLAGVGVGG